MATWNVEGLRDDLSKSDEIIESMKTLRINVCCLQETHVRGATYFMHNGYLVILSGQTDDSKNHRNTGVGFIVSPPACKSVIGFHLLSDRLAMLKLKVSGGCLHVLCGYAPHSGYHYQVRRDFFHELV